jgi:hypothetical protein
MTVYQGIVRDNVVLLPKEVHLQDGTKVEVSVVSTVPTAVGDLRSPEALEAAEAAFKQHLFERGLIAEIKGPSPAEPKGTRKPIKVKGKPISQMVIEDRR